MFVAFSNRPGFLPDTADTASEFDTAQQAWQYLYEERKLLEDEAAEDEHVMAFTPCYYMLKALAKEENWQVSVVVLKEWLNEFDLWYDGVGTIVGNTPGRYDNFDPMMVYTVTHRE